jgi:hypothetical protein
MLDTLIACLHQTTAFDTALELALAQAQLGRIFYSAGSAERAIPILVQAGWEAGIGS